MSRSPEGQTPEDAMNEIKGKQAMSREQATMSSTREQDLELADKDVSEILSLKFEVSEPIGEVPTKELYEIRSRFDKYFDLQTTGMIEHTPEWVKKVGSAIETELVKRGELHRSL